MHLPVHCSGDGMMMMLLVLCSGFLQNCLNLSETKILPAYDIFFLGKNYSEKIVLHINIKLSMDRSSVFLITGL